MRCPKLPGGVPHGEPGGGPGGGGVVLMAGNPVWVTSARVPDPSLGAREPSVNITSGTTIPFG